MITPLTKHAGATVLLEPRYYGSISWYATLASYEHAIVDYTSRYDKRRKLTHRTRIADVNGPLELTMPISRPEKEGALTWGDLLISPHDQWWNIHRVTLESAYGRTPYFEFYIDRFLPALTAGVVERFVTIKGINEFVDKEIRKILGIETEELRRPKGEVADLRRREPEVLSEELWPPYYQVRSARHGFLPGLSILDLIFNLGPEAPLYLRELMAKG